jgi:hypothetical protein
MRPHGLDGSPLRRVDPENPETPWDFEIAAAGRSNSHRPEPRESQALPV